MRTTFVRGIAAIACLLFAVPWVSGATVGPTRDPAPSEEIVVFAAASLKNAIDDIAAAWTRETGHVARVSYGGSSKLARQIQMGAPADVFISANVEWMDVLGSEKLINLTSRIALLRNRLVLIAHGKNAAPVQIGPGFDLSGLLGDGKLAMAMVESVPAGRYGKAALTSLGAWDAVADKVAQSDNVRAALALVARGEAPYGIVYSTDAAASDDVTIVGTFPEATHPPIVYPAAVVTESKAANAAQAFLDYLSSRAAKATFEQYGFSTIVREISN